MTLGTYPLEALAVRVGTPFFLYDADILRSRLRGLAALGGSSGGVGSAEIRVRYAIKANPAAPVLDAVREHGLWIDAVSGNEALRALRVGFPAGSEPAVIMFTSDVFRDNALPVVLEHSLLPNLGSPGMLRQLADAGYRGPLAVRVNPGFGHGHVASCDTGGPSSKHGIWHESLAGVRRLAADLGVRIVALHAHIGSGGAPGELEANLRALTDTYARLLPDFPDVGIVNYGGGIPHAYEPGQPPYDLEAYRRILLEGAAHLRRHAGRPIDVEVEPGRYAVAAMGLLVARVADVKETRSNAKGRGHRFVMVDAGFNDLVRPAMYGSYHHISVVGAGAGRVPEPLMVAGPLCESGDVFTRDERELLQPRLLPPPDPGDLLVLHDAGAYGAAMSSSYVSLGRAPEILWDAGTARLITRRETFDDLVARERAEDLPLP